MSPPYAYTYLPIWRAFYIKCSPHSCSPVPEAGPLRTAPSTPPHPASPLLFRNCPPTSRSVRLLGGVTPAWFSSQTETIKNHVSAETKQRSGLGLPLISRVSLFVLHPRSPAPNEHALSSKASNFSTKLQARVWETEFHLHTALCTAHPQPSWVLGGFHPPQSHRWRRHAGRHRVPGLAGDSTPPPPPPSLF